MRAIDKGALLVDFLRVRKKWWLTPIVVLLVLIGIVLVTAHGSVVAPFIYTLF